MNFRQWMPAHYGRRFQGLHKTLNGAAKLLNLTNLFKEVEGGKHKGENKWVYDLEKNAPIYNKLHSQLIDFSTEDYIFNVFN